MRGRLWASLVLATVVAGCSEPLSPDRAAMGESAAVSAGSDMVQAASGSVTIRSASSSYYFALKWQLFSGAGCTGTSGSVLQFFSVTSSGISLQLNGAASIALTAAPQSSLGADFSAWSGSDGTSSTDLTICVPAPTTNEVYTASYGQNTNTPPVLASIGNRTVDEETTLSFTATATDAETAAADLVFSLSGAPVGAAITSGGEFSWTPSESQGPGDFPFSVCVHDDAQVPLQDCEFVVVTVAEVNKAPVLQPIGDKTVVAGTPIQFTVAAFDSDLPANVLSYSLQGGPVGATIDASTGSFSWTPSQAGDFNFSIVVHDGGSPDLSDSKPVVIHVTSVPPEILEVSPASGTALPSSQPIAITGRFTAPGSSDQATCVAVADADAVAPITGTTGSGTGECTSTLELTTAGIYRVIYEVTDLNGQSDRSVIQIIVYDESVGALTANGWIESGIGTMRADPNASGRAVFAFVSRYRPGSNQPDGTAMFQLTAARFNFRGTSQDWLIVDPEAGTAELCGSGLVLGMPDTFGYRVYARESRTGGRGMIRIVIWRGSDPSDVVYDSGAGETALTVGTVSLHESH